MVMYNYLNFDNFICLLISLSHLEPTTRVSKSLRRLWCTRVTSNGTSPFG
mgnify:CR=1 FL=1